MWFNVFLAPALAAAVLTSLAVLAKRESRGERRRAKALAAKRQCSHCAGCLDACEGDTWGGDAWGIDSEPYESDGFGPTRCCPDCGAGAWDHPRRTLLHADRRDWPARPSY